MKTFRAKKVDIPKDLPEILDKQSSNTGITFRELMAEKGELHDLETWALAASAGKTLKMILEQENLPKKPMSKERLNDAVWVLMFAYCVGVMKVDKDGDVSLGQMNDIAEIKELNECEQIRFSTGKVMSIKDFTMVLHANAIGASEIYDTIAKGTFKKKIVPYDYFKLAYAGLASCNELMAK